MARVPELQVNYPDLGNVLAKAEGIKSARLQNALAEEQLRNLPKKRQREDEQWEMQKELHGLNRDLAVLNYQLDLNQFLRDAGRNVTYENWPKFRDFLINKLKMDPSRIPVNFESPEKFEAWKKKTLKTMEEERLELQHKWNLESEDRKDKREDKKADRELQVMERLAKQRESAEERRHKEIMASKKEQVPETVKSRLKSIEEEIKKTNEIIYNTETDMDGKPLVSIQDKGFATRQRVRLEKELQEIHQQVYGGGNAVEKAGSPTKGIPLPSDTQAAQPAPETKQRKPTKVYRGKKTGKWVAHFDDGSVSYIGEQEAQGFLAGSEGVNVQRQSGYPQVEQPISQPTPAEVVPPNALSPGTSTGQISPEAGGIAVPPFKMPRINILPTQ